METKTPEELLLDWSRASFVGLDRDQLTQAAEMLGVDFAKQVNDKTLRAKLCAAIGTVDATLTDNDAAKIAAVAAKGTKIDIHGQIPNLSASGRWQGRYRRIRMVRTDQYKDFNAFPIGWEGVTKYFSFDIDIDMAWPYYESLKNMRETMISKSLSKDGHETETRETTNQVLPYSDLGDTPGTEHLPIGMREYVQWMARDNDNFADSPRRDLMRVLRLLYGPQVNVTSRDLSDDDLRDDILNFIGVDIYADA
jgi:hypothetical protein